MSKPIGGKLKPHSNVEFVKKPCGLLTWENTQQDTARNVQCSAPWSAKLPNKQRLGLVVMFFQLKSAEKHHLHRYQYHLTSDALPK